MTGSALGELIFIAAMFVLILVVSFVAVYFFFKTYRKEMAEKKERKSGSVSVEKKAAERAEVTEGERSGTS